MQAGGPPIIIGGGGKHRTPRLAARYATEFNMPFVSVEDFAAQCGVVRTACEVEGRDPGTMTWSAALVACVGADEAEVDRRAAAIGREPAELRENGVAGTPTRLPPRCADGPTPVPIGSICRSSTWPISTTST